MAVKLDEHFVKAISDEDMEHVKTWLETDFNNQGCRNGMLNHWDIIKKAQRDGDLYGYRQDGKMTYAGIVYLTNAGDVSLENKNYGAYLYVNGDWTKVVIETLYAHDFFSSAVYSDPSSFFPSKCCGLMCSISIGFFLLL